MELNKYGVNACIKAHSLPDEQMREIGFVNGDKSYWYFYKDLGNEISFNVRIYLSDIENPHIEVIDEEFCQLYDYQQYLKENSNFEFAIEIRNKVEIWMEYLQNHGVLSGHIKGEYI